MLRYFHKSIPGDLKNNNKKLNHLAMDFLLDPLFLKYI